MRTFLSIGKSHYQAKVWSEHTDLIEEYHPCTLSSEGALKISRRAIMNYMRTTSVVDVNEAQDD